MKINWAKLQIIWPVIIFLIMLGGLSSCTRNKNPTINNPYAGAISIGIAPNGAHVLVSSSKFTLSQGGSASGVVRLALGEPNTYDTMIFSSSTDAVPNTNKQQQNKLSSAVQNTTAANGITINPDACVLGTSGSDKPQSCVLTFSAAAYTKPGVHPLQIKAVDGKGREIVLSPLDIEVTSNNISSIAISNSLGTTAPSVAAGEQFALTATSVNGGSSTVTFANTASTKQGIKYNPASCQVSAGVPCETMVSIESTTAVGYYTTTITGTNGAVIAPTTITFAVTAPPPPGTKIGISSSLGAPASTLIARPFTITASSVDGGYGTLNFSNANSSDNSNITYTPTSCVVTPNSMCSTEVMVGLGTPTGSYTTNITSAQTSTTIFPANLDFTVTKQALIITLGPLPQISYGESPATTTVGFSITPIAADYNGTVVADIISTNPTAATVSPSTCPIVIKNGVATPCFVTVSAAFPRDGATTIQATADNITGVTSKIITVVTEASIEISDSVSSPTKKLKPGDTFTITATSVNSGVGTVAFNNFESWENSNITYSQATCEVKSNTSCSTKVNIGANAPEEHYTVKITPAGLSSPISPDYTAFNVIIPKLTVLTQPKINLSWLYGKAESTPIAIGLESTSIPSGSGEVDVTLITPVACITLSDTQCKITYADGNITNPCKITAVSAIAGYNSIIQATAGQNTVTTESISVNGALMLAQTRQTPTIPLAALAGYDGSTYIGVPWAYSPTGNIFPSPRFAPYGSTGDCISDNLTGLIWQKQPMVGTTNWNEAVEHATTTDLCGLTNWRLPNYNELMSLINLGENIPSQANWLITQGFGNNLTPNNYWTSSLNNKGEAIGVWLGNTNDGNINAYFSLTNARLSTLAVHSATVGAMPPLAPSPQTGESPTSPANPAPVGSDGNNQAGIIWPTPRFVQAPDGNGTCITDNLTGLTWLGTPLPQQDIWDNALQQVSTSNQCGYTDWRMPNLYEMASLVNLGSSDNTQQFAWLNNNGFDMSSVAEVGFWTSTTQPSNINNAWTVNFFAYSSISLIIAKTAKKNYQYTMLVRGGFKPQ